MRESGGPRRARSGRVVGAVVALAVAASMVLAGPGGASAAEGFTIEVPVLMYHRIAPAPDGTAYPTLWVSPTRLRRQLSALKAAGWRTITARELGHALKTRTGVGRKRFVITIDDGARDGYTNGAPVFAELGMTATYCVTPGRVGRSWQLSFDEMRELDAAGHEIANHSYDHADLTALSGDALRRQVVRAHRLIRDEVGRRPRSMCYPYGRHDAEVRRLLADNDYLVAFTTEFGGRHSTAARLAAPRVRVTGYDTGEELVARLQPYTDGGTAPAATTPTSAVASADVTVTYTSGSATRAVRPR